MKCGKFEIDNIALVIIGLVVFWSICYICESNVTVEKEKTKQLELQVQINNQTK